MPIQSEATIIAIPEVNSTPILFCKVAGALYCQIRLFFGSTKDIVARRRLGGPCWNVEGGLLLAGAGVPDLGRG